MSRPQRVHVGAVALLVVVVVTLATTTHGKPAASAAASAAAGGAAAGVAGTVSSKEYTLSKFKVLPPRPGYELYPGKHVDNKKSKRDAWVFDRKLEREWYEFYMLVLVACRDPTIDSDMRASRKFGLTMPKVRKSLGLTLDDVRPLCAGNGGRKLSVATVLDFAKGSHGTHIKIPPATLFTGRFGTAFPNAVVDFKRRGPVARAETVENGIEYFVSSSSGGKGTKFCKHFLGVFSGDSIRLVPDRDRTSTDNVWELRNPVGRYIRITGTGSTRTKCGKLAMWARCKVDPNERKRARAACAGAGCTARKGDKKIEEVTKLDATALRNGEFKFEHSQVFRLPCVAERVWIWHEGARTHFQTQLGRRVVMWNAKTLEELTDCKFRNSLSTRDRAMLSGAYIPASWKKWDAEAGCGTSLGRCWDVSIFGRSLCEKCHPSHPRFKGGPPTFDAYCWTFCRKRLTRVFSFLANALRGMWKQVKCFTKTTFCHIATPFRKFFAWIRRQKSTKTCQGVCKKGVDQIDCSAEAMANRKKAEIGVAKELKEEAAELKKRGWTCDKFYECKPPAALKAKAAELVKKGFTCNPVLTCEKKGYKCDENLKCKKKKTLGILG